MTGLLKMGARNNPAPQGKEEEAMSENKEMEKALKTLMKMVRISKDAITASESLEDKVRFVRTSNDLKEALRLVRRNLYEYEDAAKSERKAIRCSECGEIQTV